MSPQLTRATISIFVGIDPSLNDFAASIYRGPDHDKIHTRLFANTIDGYQAFVDWLSCYQAETDQSIVCVEATGVYAEALCYYLYAHGLAVVLEDAGRVKRAFKQTNKNDPNRQPTESPSMPIGFSINSSFGTSKALVLEQIRTLLMVREQLVSQRSATRNLEHVLAKKVVQTDKAVEVIDDQLALLKGQIQEIEAEIKRLIAQHRQLAQMHTLLRSVPSVGLLLCAHLMVLTDGFERPVTARQLSAYVGICPYEHTSGKTVSKPAKSRRYGPPMLRKLLYLAALNLKQHSPVHSRYYARKVAEGKPTRLVLNNLSNKLLRVICAVIRDQQPYQKKHCSMGPKVLFGY